MSAIKKLKNPFLKTREKSTNCFGCSPSNAIGLQLKPYGDETSVFCHWIPTPSYEGYTNVVHGGIQATLLDEMASWFVYAMLDTVGVTKKLSVDYHKPLFISSGQVMVKAVLKEKIDNIAVINTSIVSAEGSICCTADVEYYLFPKHIARDKYNYPGKDQFW